MVATSRFKPSPGTFPASPADCLKARSSFADRLQGLKVWKRVIPNVLRVSLAHDLRTWQRLTSGINPAIEGAG
jgi:hypothetical protein